ncbi:hypothetical protein Fifi44_00032 [Erwinia phage Fifi44]|uniref:Uncharacterized protein n=1 Tax=Erwinia phage Fifi44 TaxID=2876597 RepID=A0AAE8Y192_9CAUD|nr:hypothetical protein QNG95_gp32 [Erwinia phage Fifi44]QQV88335.1 hypothetical protein pEaSNUABM27_00032 [Erwinia phage pEa_SNUABM_27]UCR74901.1 hypothetical protein Fifi44_00032 [Erwinia phage Fifi44]UCR80866.1 hypothetical protein Fifi451_00046 [Erwinia phage Fifi451]WJN63666.1 hypothetical protein Erwinia_phage_Aioli_00018 [Erwinia phage Aioli]
MAKVVTVTQYEANDGSLFLSEAEANAHDFKLENGAQIEAAAEAFVNTIGAIDRSRNMQVNTVTNFLAFYLPWVEAGRPTVERTVFDTPKEAKVVEDDAAKAADAEVAQAPVEAGEEAAPLF